MLVNQACLVQVLQELQVQVRPYMASDDYEGELKLFRDAVAAQDPVALRLKATLDAIESRGRKRTPPRPVLGFFMSGSIYGSSGGSGGGVAYGRFISCGGAEKSDDAVAVVAVDRSDDAVAQRKGEGGSFDCSSWLRESGAR